MLVYLNLSQMRQATRCDVAFENLMQNTIFPLNGRIRNALASSTIVRGLENSEYSWQTPATSSETNVFRVLTAPESAFRPIYSFLFVFNNR